MHDAARRNGETARPRVGGTVEGRALDECAEPMLISDSSITLSSTLSDRSLDRCRLPLELGGLSLDVGKCLTLESEIRLRLIQRGTRRERELEGE